MLRQKPELNIIYISERMRHSLQPVARSSLTAVVAPMGYGKTTAINWYLNERGREGAAVLRVSIYSANRAIFWKSLQKAFAQAGLTVLEGYECPTDASGAALLLDDPKAYQQMARAANPYGDGSACRRITQDILYRFDLSDLPAEDFSPR